MSDYKELDQWASELVQSQRLANADITVIKDGNTQYSNLYGYMDLARQNPLVDNAIFRIYSMTKPIICVAILMLAEEGKLQISDPVEAYIPSFANQSVVGPDGQRTPTKRPMTLHDLLTHTSGLTYGGEDHPPVSTSYRPNGIDFSEAHGSLQEMVDRVGQRDLFFQPGSRWLYSIAIDVLGRIIEVASGMPLDQFMETRIFQPLGMKDTGFHVHAGQKSRFVSNFGYDEHGQLMDVSDGSNERFLGHGTLLSGGGGLVSTRDDFLRFCQMMLAKGTFGDRQILSENSVELMTRNHLPGDLPAMGCTHHSTMDMSGIGFGYGVAVTQDQDRAAIACSNGDYSWGGVANTYFWIDPKENLIVLFLSQLFPASDMPVRAELRRRVYEVIR